jgi:hypothetical protein
MWDGWERITEVRGLAKTREPGPEVWISASIVELWILSRVSFAMPDPASEVVGPYDPIAEKQVLDCSGRWGRLSYRNPRLARLVPDAPALL